MLDALTRWTDDALASLGDRLREGGLTPEILGRAESILPGRFDAWRLPVVNHRLASMKTPAADLARLFLYHGSLPVDRATELLGDHLRMLREAGVLDEEGDGVRSRLRITPVEDLLILHDPPDTVGDAVMGPGATTLRLWRAVPRPPTGRVLDLGAGAGSFALLAARSGATVTAADVTARAVGMTTLNARLNRLTVEVLEGDVAAPVADREFDLVLTQPPFVLAPPDATPVTYLHGGPTGDELSRRFLAGIPGILAPGGVALVHLEGPVGKTPLPERIRAALPDDTTSVLVLQQTAPGPDEQATAYASLHAPTPDAFGDAVSAYLAHFDALEVTAFESALVVVRRPTGEEDPLSGLTLARELPAGPGPDAGAWRSALAAMARIAAGDALLETPLHPVEGVVLEQRHALGRGELDPRLVFPPAAGVISQEVSPAAAQLIAFVDGNRTVADVVSAYATHVGASEDEVRASVVDFLRNALLGGLVRAPSP